MDIGWRGIGRNPETWYANTSRNAPHKLISETEAADSISDPTPYMFDSDATAIKSFVRELVAQSVVPNMERMVAQWNEQVLARRRGLSGRFMSLSKRWTPFGSSRNSSSPSPMSNSNYDSLQGFYRPDVPEALMRKLADYCFMLRDYKLALSTYDILRTDFNNDKAWRHYAGAAEMAALSALMSTQPISSKTRTENIDHWLEAAVYSYTDRQRSSAPYYALRTLALGLELLRPRGSSAADDAARWAGRILESNLVGPIGTALFMERTSACYAVRMGVGSMRLGSRRRKSALWSVMAAEHWIRLEKSLQAEKCLDTALKQYGYSSDEGPVKVPFDQMQHFIDDLRQRILGCRLANRGLDEQEEEEAVHQSLVVEEVSETLDKTPKAHRRSLIGVPSAPMDVTPLSPLTDREREREEEKKDDQFE
jgi:trafficking protein particle complex subunit 8